MTTIPVAEVRGKLAALLERVEAGEVVVISRHGRPVARLIGENASLGEAAATGWLEQLRAWHGLELGSPPPGLASRASLSNSLSKLLERYGEQERWGRRGYLLDASLMTALLESGPRSGPAVRWLEQVGGAPLAVSAWSVLELEGNLATTHSTTAHSTTARPAPWQRPRSWLDEPVPPCSAQRALMDGFLEERCPLAYPEPADFRAARLVQRNRPGLAPLPLLLELMLAERTGLMPVTFKPQLGAVAQRLRCQALVLPAV